METNEELEDELLERDREIEKLNEAHDALERQSEALEDERDKYKAALALKQEGLLAAPVQVDESKLGDLIAATIREVDGDHTMGTGVLGEVVAGAVSQWLRGGGR